MADFVKPGGTDALPDAWIEGVQSPEFKMLIDAKRRTVLPMVVVYVLGYMGLSVLAGFGRGILGIRVLGAVNLGFVIIAGNYLGPRGHLRACISQQPRSPRQDRD
jgi:hypothetical protein